MSCPPHPAPPAPALPVPVPVPGGPAVPAVGPARAARHRRPRRPPALRTGAAVLASVPPARRLAAGLGLASAVAASVLTAVVDPAAPVAPDRVPPRQSSTFAQVSGD